MLFKAFLISAFSLASMVSGAAVSTPNELTERDVTHCASGAANYGHAVELNRCITDRLANNGMCLSPATTKSLPLERLKLIYTPAGFGDFDCEGRRFFLGGNSWNSARDCVTGCLPCLRSAADKGEGWVHCDQRASFATCWVGYCVPGEPCYNW